MPQLFLASGADRFTTPAFSLDHAFQSELRAEGRTYAKYIVAEKPEAKIGILYQHDGFGKDYLRMKDGFGPDPPAS